MQNGSMLQEYFRRKRSTIPHPFTPRGRDRYGAYQEKDLIIHGYGAFNSHDHPGTRETCGNSPRVIESAVERYIYHGHRVQ